MQFAYAPKLEQTSKRRRPRPEVQVEELRDADDFRRLAGQWNELLVNSSSNSLFLTWEWLYTWWRHLSRGRDLRILCVRSARELIAVAPLCTSSSFKSALGFAPLEFLGTGSVGSDYLDLIVRSGSEAEVHRTLGDYLHDRQIPLSLTHLKREGNSADFLARHLSRRDWTISNSRINVCPYIELEGLGWEDYLAGIGSSHRANIRRRIRKLNREFDCRYELARTDEERRQALDTLIALHRRRWRKRGGSDAFHESALEAFHEEFSRIALDRGWLRLFVLRLDQQPAAAFYGFFYNGRFLFYQSGFDPAFGKWSVGLVALALSIRKAAEEGAREYDLLHGDEQYKSLWAQHTRELIRLEVCPPGALGFLYRNGLHLYRSGRRMARRIIDKSADALDSKAVL